MQSYDLTSFQVRLEKLKCFAVYMSAKKDIVRTEIMKVGLGYF